MENVSPSGRRRRAVNGAIVGAGALATAVYLIRGEAAAGWYAIVFVLVLLSAVMLLQARDKT
jgi:hypothetical protein